MQWRRIGRGAGIWILATNGLWAMRFKPAATTNTKATTKPWPKPSNKPPKWSSNDNPVFLTLLDNTLIALPITKVIKIKLINATASLVDEVEMTLINSNANSLLKNQAITIPITQLIREKIFLAITTDKTDYAINNY